MLVTVVEAVALAILAAAGTFAFGSSRWTVRAGRACLPDTSIVRPALAHFIMTYCEPRSAAFEATILDLAARGFIGARSDADGIWLTYTEPGSTTSGVRLAGYEQQVLDALHGRFTNTGEASFAAVAQAARADVGGVWTSFEKELRLAARNSGIRRRRPPLSLLPVLIAIVSLASCVALAAVSARAGSHGPHALSPAESAAFTAVLFPLFLAGMALQDRLTPVGSGLAARFKQERARLTADPASWGLPSAVLAEGPEVSATTLARRAVAVAVAVPGTGSDSAARQRRLGGRVASVQSWSR
jgi:hypothetical protein